MKKMMIAVLILSVILNLCACGGSAGVVSHSGDPLTYFVSDSSWTKGEIENKFGSFLSSEAEDYGTYSYTTYYSYNISVFGESWDLWISVMEKPSCDVRGGCFSFDQKNMGDKAFVAYRDEIVAYYTELYGNPDPYCGTEDMPAWRWTTSTMIIVLQDCRAMAGNLQLSFAG